MQTESVVYSSTTDLVAILWFSPIWGEPAFENEAKSGALQLRVLSELEVGESGVLVALDLPPGVENHLMYMGFVPDARVKALHRAPAGDPTVYSVDGIEIALRRETAKAIRVRPVQVAIEPAPEAMPERLTEPAEELTEAIR
jgi:Fe2+ transport system protein FeoA